MPRGFPLHWPQLPGYITFILNGTYRNTHKSATSFYQLKHYNTKDMGD